jgi:hypothetical protein
MKKDTRSTQLEAAFAEASTTIGNITLRPFSLGTLNLCRQLNLTLFLNGETDLNDQEKQRQLVAFAWIQAAPMPEVLKAIRTGNAADKVAEFEFSLGIDTIPMLLKEVSRVSQLASAAAVEVIPKPGSKADEDAPPNS